MSSMMLEGWIDWPTYSATRVEAGKLKLFLASTWAVNMTYGTTSSPLVLNQSWNTGHSGLNAMTGSLPMEL